MEHIGRYRTERVLGSGAFGTVWLGYDETLDARVAIKVLAENWARDEAFRQRFIDEARVLWRADSDHLIRVHTVDELPDGRPYFVMDYADRGTLEERMRARFGNDQWFSVPESLAISREIAQGLRVVHALGIADRDLKPANVMYRTVPAHAGTGLEERLVLVDFGIAKNLAKAGVTTIATGTPHYMAPEQTEGRADGRSDIYSAGVVLYELLARRVPYPYDSVGELVRAHVAGSFAPLRSIRGDVTPELDATIARALSTDPEQRFADAAAWLAALADEPGTAPLAVVPPVVALAGETIGPEELRRQRAEDAAAASAGPVPPPSQPGAGAAPPSGPPGPPSGPYTPTPPPAGQPPPRRRRKLWVLPLVLVLLFGGAIGAIVATRDSTPDGPNANELVAEPISSLGENVFTQPVTPPVETLSAKDPKLSGLEAKIGELPKLKLPALNLPGLGSGTAPRISGETPGLYGGTNLLSVCDAKKLVDFLTTNADKAREWAKVLGIGVDEIPRYVSELTDVILRFDTRVVNHGFLNGKATYINSILQAGTAVLIDRFGMPVVRCKCGNPLTAAKPIADNPRVSGTTWLGFDPGKVTIIVPAPQPVSTFTTTNVITGGPLVRKPGSPAASASGPSTTRPPRPTTTTTRPKPTTTTTTVAATPVDVVQQGAVTASSSTGGYPASLATDGNASTSWFSLGSNADGDTSTFRWNGTTDQRIVAIDILNNAQNSTPNFRSNFGFNSVTVQVLAANGSVVFSQDAGLGGTPDPNVRVQPNVVGRSIVLLLHGHESPDCGGFSELRVFAT